MLAIAAGLDYLIGDPWNWLHPVQVMGWCIAHASQSVLRWVTSSQLRRLAGVGVGLGLVLGSGAVGWAIVTGAERIHPLLGVAIASLLLASCLAGRSLRAAADDVLHPLMGDRLDMARLKLSRYVGRDTDVLDQPELLRAVFETVTENATDGVMAPLFYGIIGAFLPIGSVPLALAYKAASTLDSMVGYRREPYTDLGWFSARLDDGLTWIPCRLTVLTIGLLSGRSRQVWAICRRDAPTDPSPNAGWSECVYAAALNVQVGGINVYQGQVKEKPKLGDPLEPITVEKIRAALRLTRYAVFIWLGFALLGLALQDLTQRL